MVFIQSQEYTDSFGKLSKNIISLEGQTDYKISHNIETGQYDVRIVMGDYEKYIFSSDTEVECTKILQNIFNHHSTKDAFTIYDVNAFMIPDMEPETTLEEVEELMANLLEFHGYKNVVDIWEEKLHEAYGEGDDANGEQQAINDLSISPVEQVNTDQSITPPPPIAMSRVVEQRYIHYN